MENLRRLLENGVDAHGNISEPLYEEMLLKINKIADNPDCYGRISKVVRRDLETIGNVYSFWIEHPELRKHYLTHNLPSKKVKKKAWRGVKAVNKGWEYLTNKGDNLVEILDKKIIAAVNGLVSGGNEESGRYRQGRVHFLDSENFKPIEAERVLGEVDKVIRNIKQIAEGNPLEAAIYAHLGIAMTQPFCGGNKRTARLVQDKILFDAGLPPAVISAGEAKFYFDLLGKTAPNYQAGNLEGQRQFYDYVASKVNNGLDEILGDLNPKYIISK